MLQKSVLFTMLRRKRLHYDDGGLHELLSGKAGDSSPVTLISGVTSLDCKTLDDIANFAIARTDSPFSIAQATKGGEERLEIMVYNTAFVRSVHVRHHCGTDQPYGHGACI